MTPLDQKREEARRKFGRPFAIDRGSNWKPRAVPLLTEHAAATLQRRDQANEPTIPAFLQTRAPRAIK